MEIGNKDTQYNVRKMKHATITQRYKCFLHAKFGNQPYPDDIECLLHAKFGNQIIIKTINSYLVKVWLNVFCGFSFYG